MSLKRGILFIMLVISAPVWLLLRSRFGDRFLILLLFAWATGFFSVWFLAQPNFTADLDTYQRIFVMLGEFEAPHPMYVGTFWLCRRNYAVPDVIGLAVISFVMTAEMSSRVKGLGDTIPIAVAVMGGCFLMLAYLCYMNDQVLPFKLSVLRSNQRAKPLRYLARLRSTATRSREGLGQIFSRRDPALTQITRR